ncbi:MAG TPA: hypothetical protein V6C88_04405 [Chroococcidiopsis sp.]
MPTKSRQPIQVWSTTHEKIVAIAASEGKPISQLMDEWATTQYRKLQRVQASTSDAAIARAS